MVVFNEVMYHPPSNETKLEWLELYNQMAVDVDLSGWSIDGGIHYDFPEGIIIPGGGYLVVAISPNDLASATGLTNILGPYQGRLSNSGETLSLYNKSQRLMDQLSYGVDGDWPVGADGAGVSLAKRDADSGSSPANNWTVSALVGGTPGRRNFALTPFEVTNSVPIRLTGRWKYQDSGTGPGTGWNGVEFDDSGWSSGSALFQVGAASPPIGDVQPIPSLFSTGIDPTGAVLAPGVPDPHYALTQSAQSQPPPPEIQATVIQNHPAWLANDTASSWLGPVNPGTTDVAAGAYTYRTTFSLEGFDPTTAALTMTLAADNRFTDVQLNGVSLAITYAGFSAWSPDYLVTNGFLPTINTLYFFTFNDSDSPNPAGFRARLVGSARQQIPVQTTLPQGPTTYYFRTAFALSGAPQQTLLTLQSVVADGAVFYLNGTEVLRQNMPAGVVDSATLALSNVAKPTQTGPFVLPTSSLVVGTNLLAVEVHGGPGTTPNMLFGAQLAATVTNVLVPPPIDLAFNEISSATNGDGWIELINYGSVNLDLTGYTVALTGGTTNQLYVLPTQTLSPSGLLVLSQSTLGLSLEPGTHLILYTPNHLSVLDAVVVQPGLRGRQPDGTGQWWYPTAPTPGASNRFVLRNEIVINEIMYDAPTIAPGQASPESWIELYNRSSNTVDISGWHLAKDIDYEFQTGVQIPAGGYLVVAKDVGFMQTNYPGVAPIGPFTGKLTHQGHVLLLDGAGNPANEVQYYDAKPWPEYPGGGGSSLELRDPWVDNSKPEAWAASWEGGRSGWSNYTYRATSANLLGPTQWNEFAMGLLDAGECLIDDLSVIESPSTAPVQFLQNGTFETGLTAWRALGTHSYSRVEVDPDNPANHVLHLITTGWTYHIHDHLETTYANGRTVADGRQYEISFRAKWLAGNNHLNTRLYFNRVAKTTDLPMPQQHGTPGRRNSTFTQNLGPTFSTLSHGPIVPQPSDTVTVGVSAADPQGVGAVSLWWSANGAPWKQTPMNSASPAGAPGYTNYVAILPAQPAGTLVQFFVQASDTLGAVSSYPAGGTNSRALYKVNDGTPRMPQLHRLRLLMTAADTELLHAPTNVMTYDRRGLTVISDEREIFYDVGVHLQSSERGRDDPSRVGFSLKFAPDHLFRGVQNTITLDRSGGYSGRGGKHDEILLWHAVNHAGGMYGLECDLMQVLTPRTEDNGTAMVRLSAFDSSYWDGQFKNGGQGNLYKLELIYYPLTTVNGDPQAPKLPQPDDVVNVEIKNMGDSPEFYRWEFLLENHADADDYSQVVALNKAFSLSGAALETQTTALMDVDEWLRTLAFKAFTGDVDTYTYGLNHNWKVYFRPEDGRALGLLWDMDFTFVQSIDYAAPGDGSANTYKIATQPNNYRRFYHHLLDIMNSTVNSGHLGPWAARYSGLLGEDWSGAVSYMQQRADYLRGRMPLSTRFAITSNGGQNFGSNTELVTLTGTAPLTVKDITINSVPYPVRWTSLTAWTLTVPLPAKVNPLSIVGLDDRGRTLTNATASITVTNLGALPPVPVLINEWMADNTAPGGFVDPADSLFSDWFELYNPNPVSVNLSGYSLTDTLDSPAKWVIPTNTTIAPQGFLLVWADKQTNLNLARPAGDLHADFKLSKSGSTIGLFNPSGVAQHVVVFGAQLPNVSEGLFPDGNTNAVVSMPEWTPRAPNSMDPPPSAVLGSIQVQAGGDVTFAVSALTGRTYQVEYKDDLRAASWTVLGDNRVATSSGLTITDNLSGIPQRFYRVVMLP